MRRISGGIFITFLFTSFLFAGSSLWQIRYYNRIAVNDMNKLAMCRQRIDLQNVDYPLLRATIFYETNRRRVNHGLAELQHSPYLEQAASAHSEMMALLHFYSHQSFPGSKKGFAERLQQIGINAGTMGENLADAFAIEYEPGRIVYTPDQNSGNYFSYELDGKPIKSYTYIDFARMVVDMWMQSDAHRDNILCRYYHYMGVGVSHYQNRDKFYIDQFKVTQDFATMYGGQYKDREAN